MSYNSLILLNFKCPDTEFSIYGYSPNLLKWMALDMIMSIHSVRLSTYPCFILYSMSKWDQANDVHLSGLST